MGVRTTVVDLRGLYETPSREETRRTPCPRCHATALRPCVDIDGGPRKANHRERVTEHIRLHPRHDYGTPAERLMAAIESQGFPFRWAAQDPQDQVRSA